MPWRSRAAPSTLRRPARVDPAAPGVRVASREFYAGLCRSDRAALGAVDARAWILAGQGAGLEDVRNPSAWLLEDRQAEAPGSVVAVAMEGTAPILVEVQAKQIVRFGGAQRQAERLVSDIDIDTARLGRTAGNFADQVHRPLDVRQLSGHGVGDVVGAKFG